MEFWLHLSNIIIHAVLGCFAIAIGIFVLVITKGTRRHKLWGRRFVYLGFAVCITAAIGNICFRFLPLFATLTLLVSYLLASGWRVVITRDSGPAFVDGCILLLGFCGISAMGYVLAAYSVNVPPIILYSTLGALTVVLLYDSVRWLFPHHWHDILWRYEHVYKIVSSLFAMTSAFFGNTMRAGQPWSQIAPSIVGVVVIIYFFVALYRNNHKEKSAE